MGKDNDERLNKIEKQIQTIVEEFPVMVQKISEKLRDHEAKDELKAPTEELVTLKLAIQQLNNLFNMLDQDYRTTRSVVFDYCVIKKNMREDFEKRVYPFMIKSTEVKSTDVVQEQPKS